MTETLHVMDDGREPTQQELDLARELVAQAKEHGASSAPGMLKALTKMMLETALDEEITEHLGYDKHQAKGRGSGNSRNGGRVKTVITETVGPVQIEVPRDRDGSFDPQIIRKHQRLKPYTAPNAAAADDALTDRRAVKARGHFPTEQAALKTLYLVTRALDPSGRGQNRWAARWKPALNAFAITFADRIPDLNRDRG